MIYNFSDKRISKKVNQCYKACMNQFISLIHVISFVILQCLGSGAFVVPTMLAQIGYSSYIAWILTGIGAISIGLIFVRLATNSKTTIISDLIAENFQHKERVSYFLLGLYTLAVIIGNLMMIQIAYNGIEGLKINLGIENFPTMGVIWMILTLIIVIQEYRRFNLILSILKIMIMMIVPITALIVCPAVPPQVPTQISFSGIAKALTLTLFSFIGIESLMTDAKLKPSEARYGIIIGGGICLLIYLLNTYAIFTRVPNLLKYDIPDQRIIQDVAPRLLWTFNLFLALIGIIGVQSWNRAISEAWHSKINRFFIIRNGDEYQTIADPLSNMDVISCLTPLCLHMRQTFDPVVKLFTWRSLHFWIWNIMPYFICFFTFHLISSYYTVKQVGAYNNAADHIEAEMNRAKFRGITNLQIIMLGLTMFGSFLLYCTYGTADGDRSNEAEFILNLSVNLTVLLYGAGLIAFAKNQKIKDFSSIVLFAIAGLYVTGCIFMSFKESWLLLQILCGMRIEF